MPPPKTYHSSSLSPLSEREVLSGNLVADVCVIGGGLAGMTTALELARGGRDVIVLESAEVGFGASGRNGGFVGPAWSQRLDALIRKVGESQARRLYELSMEGVRIVSGNISDLAIPDLNLAKGKLSVARTPSRDAFLRRRDRLRNEFNQQVEVWDTDKVRTVLKTPRYFEALHYPDDFQINPLAYLRGLASEAERLGGRVFERSGAKRLDTGVGCTKVVTQSGTVAAKQVVVATGGYTARLIRKLYHSYVPISTYIMLTKARPDLIATAIETPFGVGDQRRAGDYYRLVNGGTRILWGGQITTRVSEPRRLAQMLLATMTETFPQLKGLEVDYAWSGIMAYARHLMPQIRQIEEGVWSCTAFGGHGINTTAIGGKVLAEAILQQSERWRLFTPFGFDWNGGPAGRVAVQSSYWWMQARDKFGESMARAADTGA